MCNKSHFYRTLAILLAGVFTACFLYAPAHAEFMINSAIIEFNKDSSKQQDIEIVSKSAGDDYIVSEVSEMLNPGSTDEKRRLLDDPADAGLLVTPDKMILSAGSHKILRFVLLKELDSKEHIYRVAIKPVIKSTSNDAKFGLKILVGYEVLVIVRPADIKPLWQATRAGPVITISNDGNSNVVFQTGQQCNAEERCKTLPTVRTYPGTKNTITLPADLPAHYSVWDGVTTEEKIY